MSYGPLIWVHEFLPSVIVRRSRTPRRHALTARPFRPSSDQDAPVFTHQADTLWRRRSYKSADLRFVALEFLIVGIVNRHDQTTVIRINDECYVTGVVTIGPGATIGHEHGHGLLQTPQLRR